MITLSIIALLVVGSACGAYYDQKRIGAELSRFHRSTRERRQVLAGVKGQVIEKRQVQLSANLDQADRYLERGRHRFNVAQGNAQVSIYRSRDHSQKLARYLTAYQSHLRQQKFDFEDRQTHFKASQQRYRQTKRRAQTLQVKRYLRLNRQGHLDDATAKAQVLRTVTNELKRERDINVKSRVAVAANDADRKARNIIIEAIQRGPVDLPQNQIRKSVNVPDSMLKRNLLSRDQKHLRLIASMTGTDLFFDKDDPSLLHIATNDPIRREVARRTLSGLIVSHHIVDVSIEHQVRIAQVKAIDEVRQSGERAVQKLRLGTMSPDLIKLLGRLKFRTSYGQNVLYHSMEVGQMTGVMAAELGLNSRLARRAGLLHDFGKSIDHEVVGTHVELGTKLAQLYHEDPVVVNAIAAHHGDVAPTNLISILVPAADALSGARPGARSESIEEYIKRLRSLEAIANEQKGVKESYAIQAGRELRIIVDPRVMDDAQSSELTKHVRDRIQHELSYPGKIKITTIRILRAFQYVGDYYRD